MISTRRNKEQNKNILSQLTESDTDFMIGQINHETQPGDRINTADKNTTLNKANISIQVNGSQMDIHTLEKKYC